jgi:hypothetical protein
MQGAKFDVTYVVNGSEYVWYYLFNDKYIHIGPYLCKLFISLKGEKRFIVMLYRNIIRCQTCIWCVKSLKLDNLFNNGIEKPLKTSCSELAASLYEFWRMNVLKD